jgi:hypothetical protein
MFDLSDPKMFWLNITNIVLGIITLVCFVVVGYGVIQDVLARIRKSKTTPVTSDDHAFLVHNLDVTMADGGERIDKTSLAVSEKGQIIVLKPNTKRNPKK